MGRTTQSPELYTSTVSPDWKCNLILYTSQACPPRLTGPVPIQYSTPHTLPSAVTSETWKMSSPYSNLSTEVQTAITELESDSVGLVLTESVSPDQRNQLMSLLEKLTALKSQTLLPPEHRLGALGASIVKGAELLAQGIEVGAEKAGELIEYVTEKSQEELTKAEEDAKVGKVVKGSVDVAKTATTATVKVSGFVSDRVGKLTKSLASYLAKKATPSSTTVGTNKKSGAMAYLVDAARGGLIGYGTVYNGLETSAKVLGANVKENSVKVVSHKYGVEAGNVFGEACTAAGNAAMTYMNVQSLGVKGLVKKTAKQTGKNVVKNVLTDSSGKSVTTKQ